MATRPAIDSDVLLAWGIVAFIALMGVAAVGFYAGMMSSLIMEIGK
jgi:hypothetical protein